MKIEIVKFKDGRYGVRKTVKYGSEVEGYMFLDRYMDWQIMSLSSICTFDSAEKAREAMEDYAGLEKHYDSDIGEPVE